MPIHPDWRKVLDSMIKQYGKDKGTSVFYATMKKKGVDYTKPKGAKKMKALWYSRPFLHEEVEKDGQKKLYIAGNAVEVGISRNKVEYTKDALESAASSLIGKPLLLNHGDTDVRNIVGKIVDAKFENNGIPFKAEIDQDELSITSKIKKGFINSVSIGANCGKVVEDENGIKHPSDLEFLELSLVPVPGVANATISQVIEEKFDIEKLEVEKMQMEEFKKELDAIKATNEELVKKNEELMAKIKEEEETEPKPEPEPEKPAESATAKLEEKLMELEKKIEENKGIVDAEAKEKPKMRVIHESKDKDGKIGFHCVDAEGKLLY